MSSPRRARGVATVVALTVVAVLAGCGSGAGAASGSRQRLLVFAASSLTEPFETIGRQFEAAHPGVDVTFSFASSSSLATQITEGAPADVFASASTPVMDGVVAAAAVGPPRVFARNTMQIAVPPDNPAGVAAITDLARPDVSVALCQPQVPCGALARQVLVAAGLTVRAVTEESDVRSTLTKVRLGEVDAALVYSSDVRAAAGAVTGIRIPDTVNATTSYPITAVAGASDHVLAAEFIDHVLSRQGETVLRENGFLGP